MNQERVDLEISCSVSLERRILWLTVSKAADRSSSNRVEDWPAALAERSDSIIGMGAVLVEWPCQTRGWDGRYNEICLNAVQNRFSSVTQENCLIIAPSNGSRCYLKYSALGKDFFIWKHWHILSSDPLLENEYKDSSEVVYKCPHNRTISESKQHYIMFHKICDLSYQTW